MRPLRARIPMLAAASLLGLAATACAGQLPLLTSDPSGTALFQQGQDGLVERDWRAAINAFDTLLRNYPSSPYLADARLGIGRAYYEQGRVDSLILAVDAFQSFLTYHPSHPLVDYAQYMVGMTYVAQMRSADRDQTATLKAIDAFDALLRSYPESDLAPAAAAQRLAAIDRLAEHEWQVARWQARREEDWDAAVDRVTYALEHYPDTTLKCRLFFTMAEAYKTGAKLADAASNYERVVTEYPDCEHAEEAQKKLLEIKGAPGQSPIVSEIT